MWSSSTPTAPPAFRPREARKVWCFGNAADMSRFAPKMQLTAIENIWGPYYISRAKAMLDGTWKSDDAWWGMKEGALVMAPYNKAMPDNVKAAADKMIAGWKDGSYDVFTGPILDQSGKERVAQGRADGRQGPRGDRLVRQGRPKQLSLAFLWSGGRAGARRGLRLIEAGRCAGATGPA